MLLLAVIHPPAAQGEAAGMDIAKYAVSGNYQVVSPTVIRLGNAGDVVSLKGPITISVATTSEAGNSEETVTIGAGETRKFGPLAPPWSIVVIRLVSVGGATSTQSTQNYGLDLLLGASGEQILGYIKSNAKDQGDDEIAGETALAAEATFTQAMTQAITEAGGSGADLPNLADAAQTFGLVTHLILVRDTAGKPLFPLLHTTGIKTLLTRMTIAAAVNDKNLTALKSLVFLLAGMDIARYKPVATP
jgi:hypothetical protein